MSEMIAHQHQANHAASPLMADRGFTYSEQHKLECMARHIAVLRTTTQRARFLDDMEKIHGEAAIGPLRRLVRAEWEKRKGSLKKKSVYGSQPSLL